jgi:hypothetical protein
VAQTPDPTNEESWAALPLVDGRASIAMREIVRRLRNNLPALVNYANTQLGYGEGKGIPQVAAQDIRVSPAVLDDSPKNCVLVSIAVNTEVFAPGTFKTESQVVIYSIEGRIESSEQVEDAWDRAGLIRAVLYHYLTGCRDAQDRVCWRLLEPQQVSFLPEPFQEYSGAACYYRLVQSPEDDNWI